MPEGVPCPTPRLGCRGTRFAQARGDTPETVEGPRVPLALPPSHEGILPPARHPPGTGSGPPHTSGGSTLIMQTTAKRPTVLPPRGGTHPTEHPEEVRRRQFPPPRRGEHPLESHVHQEVRQPDDAVQEELPHQWEGSTVRTGRSSPHGPGSPTAQGIPLPSPSHPPRLQGFSPT